MTIMKYFVGSPRPGQAWILPIVEKEWNNYDVIVIQADTGEGKGKIAECISRWRARTETTSIQVPNNVLLSQYEATTKLDLIKRKDLYMCVNDPKKTCEQRCRIVGSTCRSHTGNPYHPGACPYTRDLRRSRSTKKLVSTYHSYMAHGLNKDVLIFDEAHNLLPFFRNLHAKRIWRHDYKYPYVPSISDVWKWLDSLDGGDEKLDLLHETLTSATPRYTIDLSPQEFRGEEKDCISLVPLDIRDQPNPIWKDQKLVLMSATINHLDIEQLGLGRRRVLYLTLESQSPVEDRPIIIHPVADMRRSTRADELGKLVHFLDNELLPQHEQEKGLIHCTYEVAKYLRQHLKDPRFIFHNHLDKTEKLSEFLVSPPHEGRVLVGSGMYEGLDLAGPKARFQVITSIPRKSLDDPAMMWMAENRPDLYDWETIRDLEQASGRVWRGAGDYGITIIADSSFIGREDLSPLLSNSFKKRLIYTDG